MVAQVPGAKNSAAADPSASWFLRSCERALRFVSWPASVATSEQPVAEPLLTRAPSFEQKFLFARCHAPLVLEYLEHALRPDPLFDQGRISSIYYDTPALDFYEEKRASDYLKTKIRLRWYGDLTDEVSVNCFLEVKAKIGATREKARYPIEVPAAALKNRDLSAPVLKTIPAMLPALGGHSFAGAIMPMLTVQYERRRYVEPATGTRVAVDTDICCPAVNQGFVPGVPPTFVNACVLEIKGGHRDLPHWLEPIRRQVKRDAFSKYAACFENLLQPTGRRE